jgi:hypothetical protein
VPNSNVNQSQPRGVHHGVAGFFRASCYEARRGGDQGYYGAGYNLARALGSQSPDDLESDEWCEAVEVLQGLLAHDDDEPVWTWFVQHYPKMMALVPRRRRDQFVAGVRGAYDEGHVEV